MNLFIQRSGEIVRSTALFGVEKGTVKKYFGTIILERVVDLICMMGFLVLTLIFKYKAIVSFYNYVTEEKNKTAEPTSNLKWFLIIGVILTLAILFFALRKKLEKLTIYKKALDFGKGIFHGLTSIFKLKQKGTFILLSRAIWISYYLAAYFVCFF